MRYSPLLLFCLAIACGKSEKKRFDRGTLDGSGGSVSAGSGGAAAGVAGQLEAGGTSNGAGTSSGGTPNGAGRSSGGTGGGEAGSDAGGTSGAGEAGASAGGSSAAGTSGGGAGGSGAAAGEGGESGEEGAAGDGGAPPDDPRFNDFVLRSRALSVYEGRTVYARFEQVRDGSDVRSGVITGGFLEIVWHNKFDRQTFGATVKLFVDLQPDGVCRDDTDPVWQAYAGNLARPGQPEIFEFDPEDAGARPERIICVNFAD